MASHIWWDRSQHVSGVPFPLHETGLTTLFGSPVPDVKIEPALQTARPEDVILGYVLEVHHMLTRFTFALL